MSRERLLELLEKHLDGTLSDGEAGELSGLLAASDEAFRTYLDTIDLHVDLGNSLAPERATARLQRVPPRPSVRRTTPWGAWAAAAASVLIALAAAFWAGRKTQPPGPIAGSEPKEEPTRFVQGEVVAVLESVRGDVRRTEGTHEEPVRAGTELSAGHGLRTGTGSAQVRFLEGTRVDLLADSRAGFPGPRGVHLVSGSLSAEVAPQTAGRAFVFRTPHAEATVLGTRLMLGASGDATRLEVSEGRVQLQGLADPRAITVPAGYHGLVEGKGAPRLRASGEAPGGWIAGGLRATYYDENTWTGRTLERVDARLQLFLDETKNELPPIGNDRNFAVRWEGKFLAEEEGEYAFLLGVDGWGRLQLGAEVLIADEKGHYHPIHRNAFKRHLAAGWHDFVLEYADDRANSHCVLRYVPPGLPAPPDFKSDLAGYEIPGRLWAARTGK
jgi:ferric-dicitrate binding protein FerR (iron transport regulator)